MSTALAPKDSALIDVPDGITLAHAIVDSVRDPLLVLDEKLHVIAASRSYYQTFHLTDEDVRGQLLYDIDGGQWNIPELRAKLESVLRDYATIEEYEIDHKFRESGQRTMCLNARRVFYATENYTTVMLAFEDITSRR